MNGDVVSGKKMPENKKKSKIKNKDCAWDRIFRVFLTFCCCSSESTLLLSLAIGESSGEPKETESLYSEHIACAHKYL